MDMENIVYKMQCVVHEKGRHTEGSSHALAEEIILWNKELLLRSMSCHRWCCITDGAVAQPEYMQLRLVNSSYDRSCLPRASNMRIFVKECKSCCTVIGCVNMCSELCNLM
ncbi:hypothetical protein AVEN_171011-1 [Araneus ventricosus]|uniref:Uncharacterized protein n=1 Tax=Araneus ventricosus TaxID=182803 RepID=A0A4Y2VU24_ARAVE|nr:hypothetical protein AVEN_32868-1 [Araneus ventricosus]GBO28181.1 hypothetical protein AVEN_171011-1 [Araneus ventricosus]